MIDKLYKLKKAQIEQVVLQKKQIDSRIFEIDLEVKETIKQIHQTSVDRYGAISDFYLLEIHKNTMKEHNRKLLQEKNKLEYKLEILKGKIVELQKESEKFKYIKDEMKKEKMKKVLKEEEEQAAEYVQSRYHNKGVKSYG